MASLHRDQRKSPLWYVSYRIPDRKQHFRSTRETDRVKAEAFAATIGQGIGKAEIGAFTEMAMHSILADRLEEDSGRKLCVVLPEKTRRHFEVSTRAPNGRNRALP